MTAPAHLVQQQHQIPPSEGATQTGRIAQSLLSLQHLACLEVEVAQIVLAICIRRTQGQCHQVLRLSLSSLATKPHYGPITTIIDHQQSL